MNRTTKEKTVSRFFLGGGIFSKLDQNFLIFWWIEIKFGVIVYKVMDHWRRTQIKLITNVNPYLISGIRSIGDLAYFFSRMTKEKTVSRFFLGGGIFFKVGSKFPHFLVDRLNSELLFTKSWIIEEEPKSNSSLMLIHISYLASDPLETSLIFSLEGNLHAGQH